MTAALGARSHRGIATAVLVGCCCLWGLSFPVMPVALDPLSDRSGGKVEGSLILNAWRYGAAAVLAALLAVGRWRGLTRRELVSGWVLGFFVAGGMILQTLGLCWILPSLSAVLTALSVITVAIAEALLFRRRVPPLVWVAAVVALAGSAILAGRTAEGSTPATLVEAPPFPFAGELCTVVAALFFTGHIISVDRFCRDTDPLRTTPVLFAVVGLISAVIALNIDAPVGDGHLLLHLAGTWKWLAAMAALVVLCSVGALTLMNLFQPAIPAATASVVYCLEPVFAALFSLLLGMERLTLTLAVGGGLVVAAALMASRRPTEVSARP